MIVLISWYRFLYQVVPGTTEQCQRLLIRSTKIADLDTIQKLVCINVMCHFMIVYIRLKFDLFQLSRQTRKLTVGSYV